MAAVPSDRVLCSPGTLLGGGGPVAPILQVRKPSWEVAFLDHHTASWGRAGGTPAVLTLCLVLSCPGKPA